MSIQLTDDDYALLRDAGSFGVIATDDALRRRYSVRDLSPKQLLAKTKYFQRRLRQLRAAGLIELHGVTLNTVKGPRRLPSLIRLTLRGADEVEDACGERPPRPARSDPPSLLTFQHRVGVTRVLLALCDAAAHEGLPPPRWILEQDTYPEVKPNARRHEQFILYEHFGVTPDGRTIACRPDASICLSISTAHTLIGYIEYDRSTDKREQIRAKVAPYNLLLDPKHARYRAHWPLAQRPLPRVLFIAPSRERITNVSQWILGLPGAEYFRFAVEADLNRHLLRAPVWRAVLDPHGHPGHCILPASSS